MKTNAEKNTKNNSNSSFFQQGYQTFFSPKSTFFSPTIQTKLEIGSPNDKYEQEADSMADRVVNNAENSSISESSPAIQRKCSACEEEEKVQRKPFDISPIIQKSGNDGGGIANDAISSQITASKGGGKPMSESTKTFMENRFGNDFSGVRIHTDSNAIQLSQNLDAQAFTVGNDVFFNQGKYSPDSDSGKHLLAHELTHTVQQNGGIEKKIQRELFAPSRTPSDAIIGLNGEQVELAIAFNQTRLRDPYFVILLRDIMGGGIDETTSEINEEFVTAISEWQAEHHLPQDGMLGHRTTQSFFIELIAEGLERDAIILLIESYDLPWNRHLNDVIISSGANACNVNGSPSDATVSGGICPPNIGRPINLIVCRTSIPRGVANYDHFVRIIGHELIHLLYCSSGVTFNVDETEFDAFFWEACAEGRMRRLTPAQRVNHANIALGHFASIPTAGQTPNRIRMRDQLNNLVTDGGVGTCHT